jgi:hypothetical protein
MKKLLLSAVAVAALGTAAPASAQIGGILQDGIEGLFGGGGRLGQLDNRIENSYRRGEISRAEAERLHSEYLQLRRLEQEYRVGGLSREERYDLQRRVEMLERRIDQARYGGGSRYDRDGRWDNSGDRYGRNGCPPGLARKNNGCLPPGQAKKRGDIYDDRLGGMLSGFGARYRDNERFIYRSDNTGRIYQVDRRTGRIVRVIDTRR